LTVLRRSFISYGDWPASPEDESRGFPCIQGIWIYAEGSIGEFRVKPHSILIDRQGV
jgi:hypothetical protein